MVNGMKRISTILKDKKGMALGISLFFLTLLSLLGVAGITTSITDIKIASNNLSNIKALYIAEAGIARAEAELINDLNNDQDMAIATNRMLDLNGGVVLVNGGNIISEVPLPIAGIQSTQDVKTLARQMETMKSNLKTFGCNLDDPMFTIHFLCMPGLPYIRILPKGVLDITTLKILFPFIEQTRMEKPL